jgi:hypothetical protein
MQERPLRILFAGMIAADPHQGGATWAVLQYLLGLRRLGHDVWFVEPVPADKWRPIDAQAEETVNARYFRDVMNQFGLANRAALLSSVGGQTVGVPYAALLDAASTADLLINVSGMLADPALIDRIPMRLYLDLDPVFIQLWHASGRVDMRFAAHTHFATVGLALGQPQGGCTIPTCGVEWIHTLPPVVLEHWPRATVLTHHALTTIANWRSYGSIVHEGVSYGQKAHSLRQLIDLPTRTSAKFSLALSIHPDETTDLTALKRFGWNLLDPLDVAATPEAYRQFIAGSWAEFGVAKHGYVLSKSAWFSDRSACYLASGRPALAQDTGFSRYIPTGEGLLCFSTSEEAIAGIESLQRSYATHSAAARRLAEEYFDSDKVLSRLLRNVGVAP